MRGWEIRVARSVAVGVLALILSVRAASAEAVLFSSFGPGTSFNTVTGSFFGFEFGQEGSGNTTFERAVPFTPATTATLQSLVLALQFPFSLTNGTLQVNLFSATGPTPGALLETMTSGETGSGIFAYASLLHPTLNAGTTYFVAPATTGEADGEWFTSPVPGAMFFPDVFRVNGGPWQTGTREWTTAFSVIGDPVAGSPTPEPATLVLLATGAALLRRPRRRRSSLAA